MGILPSSHDERLWKEDLGVEIAYVLIGNLGKMRNLCVCVCVYVLMLCLAQQGQDTRLPSTVWANAGVRKFLHLGTVIYC